MEFALPEPVLECLNRLNQAGFAAYAVGGCVRDHVLGVQPHDYDICTAARPEDMKRVFSGERTVETGIQHGTLTVLLSGMPLEITTFRVDGEYLDGRHPDSVRFTGRVEDDLSRRDFTINAMAYAPGAGIVDPFGGREDCEAGIVRCVGEPELRFGEDALRILRALRFAARYGFAIEEESYNKDTHTFRVMKVRKLYDVSAVSIPANPGTDISAKRQKDLDGVIEEERAERLAEEKRQEQLKLIQIRLKLKQ